MHTVHDGPDGFCSKCQAEDAQAELKKLRTYIANLKHDADECAAVQLWNKDLECQNKEIRTAAWELMREHEERLAQEGLTFSWSPQSHYSPAVNKILEILDTSKGSKGC